MNNNTALSVNQPTDKTILFKFCGVEFSQPKYSLGVHISSAWTCDDDLVPSRFGKTFIDYGVIVGHEPLVKDSVGQWGYYILWLKSDNGIPIRSDYADGPIPESQLDTL